MAGPDVIETQNQQEDLTDVDPFESTKQAMDNLQAVYHEIKESDEASPEQLERFDAAILEARNSNVLGLPIDQLLDGMVAEVKGLDLEYSETGAARFTDQNGEQTIRMTVVSQLDPETQEMVEVRPDPSEMEWIKVMDDGQPVEAGLEAHMERMGVADDTQPETVSASMMDVIVPALRDLDGEDIEVNQATGEVRITNEIGEEEIKGFTPDPAAQDQWVKIAEDGQALQEGIKQLQQTETQQRILLDIVQEQGNGQGVEVDSFMNNEAFQLFAQIFQALFSGEAFDFEGLFDKLKNGNSENALEGFGLAGGEDVTGELVNTDELETEKPKVEVEDQALKGMAVS